MTFRALVRASLFFALFGLAGCSSTSDSDTARQPGADAPSPQVATRSPVEPSVRYVPTDALDGMTRAVVVEGFPLVHTRQLLPLDGEGKLVGGDSAQMQVEQVLTNLEFVLNGAGSGLTKLIRLNIGADSPETVDLVRAELGRRTGTTVRPAITSVLTPLPDAQARIAVDAVAIAADQGAAVVLQRCETLSGDEQYADAAVVPRGGVVYLSGQPDKSPLAEAAAKSLAALLDIVDQLNLDRSSVVQLKAFVQPAAEAEQVMEAVKRAFPDQLAPPVVFVEWIASAPVEIEMIVSLPLADAMPADSVRYYTPPGVKPSPTFSRVALVETERQIYISGLSARTTGDGEAQVRDVFEQLQSILTETGSDLRHLVKATYYVSDDDASDKLNQLRPEFYAPDRPPAASKVTVHGMAQSDRTLTIDMIAVGGD